MEKTYGVSAVSDNGEFKNTLYVIGESTEDAFDTYREITGDEESMLVIVETVCWGG